MFFILSFLLIFFSFTENRCSPVRRTDFLSENSVSPASLQFLLSSIGEVFKYSGHLFLKKFTDFAKITIFLLILFHINRMFITLQILYKL
ncbi:MAG TPA: hypothetical protein DEG12_04210 [Alistipes sp.]|nr:hypothetical protein [Alistipes sp.]